MYYLFFAIFLSYINNMIVSCAFLLIHNINQNMSISCKTFRLFFVVETLFLLFQVSLCLFFLILHLLFFLIKENLFLLLYFLFLYFLNNTCNILTAIFQPLQ